MPPIYVLDEMQLWEVPLHVDGLRYQWLYIREGQRLQTWAALAPWSKSGLSPEEVIRYPWDEVPAEEDVAELTREEVEAMADSVSVKINKQIERDRYGKE